MNTAAKALSDASFSKTGVWRKLLSKQFLFTSTLALAVFVSAICVVYVKDLNRRLFIDLSSAQAEQSQLQTEWGQLLLEQGTWSTQARIQKVAQEQLNMTVTDPKSVQHVRLPAVY